MQALLFLIITYYLYTLFEEQYSGLTSFVLAVSLGALLAALWPFGVALIIYMIITGQ